MSDIIDQIEDLTLQIQVLKADAWVETITPLLPYEVGDIVATAISQEAGRVIIQGEGGPENFWPLTVVNPPLNADAEGNIDIISALNDILTVKS